MWPLVEKMLWDQEAPLQNMAGAKSEVKEAQIGSFPSCCNPPLMPAGFFGGLLASAQPLSAPQLRHHWI